VRLPTGLALVAIGLAVLAPAGNGESRSALVIRVKSVLVAHTTHDVAPTGPSKGDFAVEGDDLFNLGVRQFGKPAHARVGTDRATITFVTNTRVRITGVARFPAGTVTFVGSSSLARPTMTVTVTGGTGRYAHARGTATAGGTATNVNTYHLTLP
jgi:hypothetical protein